MSSTPISMIDEEMAFVFGELGCTPQDAQRVFEAIQEGRIDGSTYVYQGAGCFYGHLAHLDDDAAHALATQTYERFAGASWRVEELLHYVQPGDLPGHNTEGGRMLAELVTALQPYLPLGEKQEEGQHLHHWIAS